MGTPYSMNGFFGIWSEALERSEPTIAFELANGRGRFLFIMFFDPEDERTKDKLLLFLQNTKYMLRLKLYGAHRKGEFQIYLEDWQVAKIRQELLLSGVGGPPFDIGRFLESLNGSIPLSIPLASKIKLLRDSRAAYQEHLADILDFHDRTELIGEVQLPPEKRPKEKTLRKLYLYSAQSPEDIATYISDLKSRNCTLSWRTPSCAPEHRR